MATLARFAADIAGSLVLLETYKHQALEKSCEIVETEAKRVIGTYEYGWPQLAESTQEERSRLGYPENEPLLRDGTLRDSIEHTVIGDSGYIGSNEDIAVYQELGTKTIPPRSFLAGAAREKEEEVHERCSRSAYLALSATLGLTTIPFKHGT